MSRWAILLVASFVSAGGLAMSNAFAEEPAKADEELDVTMRVIADPDAKVPEEIVRRIPLPSAQPAARGQPAKPAAPGQEKKEAASEARERGRELGQDTATRARERAEEHRHNNNGNRGPPDDRPGGPPPDPPGRPKPPATRPGG
jgi:hypothetical protein